jgi:predicted outer membrane lipoprotein
LLFGGHDVMNVFVLESAKLRQYSSVLKPFAIGVALFLLGVASNWICRNLLGGRFMVLDAFVLAVAAGIVALWYEHLRTRELIQKLIVVREESGK